MLIVLFGFLALVLLVHCWRAAGIVIGALALLAFIGSHMQH